MIKRIFDFSVACLLIIGLFPLFILVALVLVASLGRPIIFRQTRTGKDGRRFTLFKFRSMLNPTLGSDQNELSRITRVGRILRITSIDELPQLFNVVIGDMSIVGPRPLLPEYDHLYTRDQLLRFSVLPGITGLAQVKGRNKLSWERKLKLDLFYVKRRNFCFDLKILFLTTLIVVKPRGVELGVKFAGTCRTGS